MFYVNQDKINIYLIKSSKFDFLLIYGNKYYVANSEY